MEHKSPGSTWAAYRILSLLSLFLQAQLGIHGLSDDTAAIKSKPALEAFPSDVSATAGDSVTLDCLVSGDPEPEVTWSRGPDKELLPAVNDTRMLVENGTLRINAAREMDENIYTCETRNSEGSVSGVTRLEVRVKPNFQLAPEDVEVKVGERVALPCLVTGSPPPTVFWSRGTGQHLLFPSQDRDRFSVDKNGTLVIESVEVKDAGKYHCQGLNIAGSVAISVNITVRDKVPPTFDVVPKNVNQTTGSTAVIPCKASGFPKPITRWYHDSRPIVESDRVKKMESGSLRIAELRLSDAGVYACKATNNAGEITHNAILLIHANTCPCIQTPNNGEVTVYGNKPGDVARFACDRGYSMVGPEYLHCTNDGEWSNPPPQCTDGSGTDGISFAECDILVPEKSTVLVENYQQLPSNTSRRYPHGTELSARCAHIGRYTFHGRHNIACIHGQWSEAIPYCTPNHPDRGNSTPTVDIRVDNGQQLITPEGRLAVRPGARVTLTCRYNSSDDWFLYWVNEHRKSYPTRETEDTGLELTITDISQSDSGEFSCVNLHKVDRTTISITVEDWTCPESVINSENLILLEEDNKLGGKAIFQCVSGYVMEGSNTSTCRIGGKWYPPSPQCTGAECPCLDTSPNVVARTARNARVYHTYFSCLPGYHLEGPTDIVCTSNGIWSEPAPKCVEIDCGPPPGFREGKLVGNKTTLGGIFYFWCNKGAVQKGSSHHTRCQADGKWSHRPPTCLEIRCNQSEVDCFSLNCSDHAHFLLPRDANSRHWGCCDEVLYDMRIMVCEKGFRLRPCSKGFPCGNGNCVRNGAVCDGNNDCSDGTDEKGCDPCHGEQFRCRDGQCVEFDYVCDRDKNCLDGSDEAGCARGWAAIGEAETAWCGKEEFTCPGDRACLPLTKVCDGHYDCDGGYDEERCGVIHCNPRVETCRTVTCPRGEPSFIPLRTRYVEWGCCQRDLYSRRTSFCSSHGIYPCPLVAFRCANGNCIPPRWQCDSDNDCSDGTDETGCYGCPAEEYNCGDRQCVHVSRVCDKRKDCYNGMDECNCARSDGQFCGAKQYRCYNDNCIGRERVCNQVDDCGDGSDELKCVPE